MDQETVVGSGARIDDIDVGRQEGRRLRLAHRQKDFRIESVDRSVPQQTADL